MMYIYDPEKLDELLETVKDDDSITITGRQLRELADTIRTDMQPWLNSVRSMWADSCQAIS